MNEKERNRADDVAVQIALMELVRLAIGEICYHDDPAEFRRRLIKLEEAAVNSLNGRTHFAQATSEVEEYVKASSSALVTKVMSSIRHPSEEA
ncbi:hypothetical protein AJ87_05835 [Rhizobium yanglingense]|nr:hypothetical protein AJ87_05835 [Rhizobium yanglingense]